MPNRLSNNGARKGFEWALEAGTAFASYRLGAGSIAIYHTEVPAAARGSGVGSAFIRQVPQEVSRPGPKLEPECAFVPAMLAKNPEFDDFRRCTVLPAAQRRLAGHRRWFSARGGAVIWRFARKRKLRHPARCRPAKEKELRR